MGQFSSDELIESAIINYDLKKVFIVSEVLPLSGSCGYHRRQKKSHSRNCAVQTEFIVQQLTANYWLVCVQNKVIGVIPMKTRGLLFPNAYSLKARFAAGATA
jgi:hypothetical protein